MFNPLTQESEQLDLSPITNALDSVRRAVIANAGQESIEVSNFDEVRLAIKKEISVLVDKLKPLMMDMCKAMPEMPSEMRVSNFPKMEVMPETMTVSNLSELGDLLTRLIQSVESINVSPIVNVPAPIVNIPEQMAPVVNIPPMPMQMPTDLSGVISALKPLGLLSRDPNRPITVRMSDGRSFIDAIANVLKANGEKIATMVSTNYGISQAEFRVVQQEASGMEIPRHDYMARTLPIATQEVYTYRLGGVSGAVQAVVTINYSDATLATILNVARTAS